MKTFFFLLFCIQTLFSQHLTLNESHLVGSKEDVQKFDVMNLDEKVFDGVWNLFSQNDEIQLAFPLKELSGKARLFFIYNYRSNQLLLTIFLMEGEYSDHPCLGINFTQNLTIVMKDESIKITGSYQNKIISKFRLGNMPELREYYVNFTINIHQKSTNRESVIDLVLIPANNSHSNYEQIN